MIRTRVIPTLLLMGEGLYKTVKFSQPKYVGDPINIVKLFNEKEADELVLLDISATKENRQVNLEQIRDIVSEAFVPLGYGGGIRTVDEVGRVLAVGIEKVIINSAAVINPDLIREAARRYGSQSIVVSIDARKQLFGGYRVYINGGRKKVSLKPEHWARQVEELGAGELLLTSIDREGSFQGYDLDLVKSITSAVNIPVIVNGGAKSIDDFVEAVNLGGASAVAAGSMFVFQKSREGILVSFPGEERLRQEFYSRIQSGQDT